MDTNYNVMIKISGGDFMSTYYSFYVGYEAQDGKIHTFGPYDRTRKIRPIVERSRSFIPYDFTESFHRLFEDKMADDLKEDFTYTYTIKELNPETGEFEDKEETGREDSIYVAHLNQLPNTNYMIYGYFPMDEIMDYVNNDNKYDYYFSNKYDVEEFGFVLKSAIDKGDKEEIDRLKNYQFFSYPDYSSKEYLSNFIYEAVSYNGPFDEYIMKSHINDQKDIKEEDKYKETVIIMTID